MSWTGHATDFNAWRDQARALYRAQLPPHQVHWDDAAQPSLLSDGGNLPAPVRAGPRVPKTLLAQLERAAACRIEQRWNLLYRVLWRVAEGDRSAMLAGDADGSQLVQRLTAVRREVHHMHAFVRFQPAPDGLPLDLIGWHQPRHQILRWVGDHFHGRLGRRRWLLATPDDGALHGDGEQVHWLAQCPPDWASAARSAAGEGDPMWERYFSSTFNPNRLNPQAQLRHMPRRFLAALPEGALSARLIQATRRGAAPEVVRHGAPLRIKLAPPAEAEPAEPHRDNQAGRADKDR